jgi:hypothetical protein
MQRSTAVDHDRDFRRQRELRLRERVSHVSSDKPDIDDRAGTIR